MEYNLSNGLVQEKQMTRIPRLGALVAVLLAVSLIPVAAGGQLYRPRHRAGSQKQGHIVHLRDVERYIYLYTNKARRQHGLSALDRDEDLAAVARAHSDDMLRRNFFSHTSPDGKTLKERLAPAMARFGYRAGENIYGGSGHDYSDARLMGRSIVDGWMTSPSHRSNVLNPAYSRLGVGVSARGEELRATQVFMQPMPKEIRMTIDGDLPLPGRH
jgi:uncharacterized protein YkwD